MLLDQQRTLGARARPHGGLQSQRARKPAHDSPRHKGIDTRASLILLSVMWSAISSVGLNTGGWQSADYVARKMDVESRSLMDQHAHFARLPIASSAAVSKELDVILPDHIMRLKEVPPIAQQCGKTGSAAPAPSAAPSTPVPAAASSTSASQPQRSEVSGSSGSAVHCSSCGHRSLSMWAHDTHVWRTGKCKGAIPIPAARWEAEVRRGQLEQFVEQEHRKDYEERVQDHHVRDGIAVHTD